MAARVKSLGNTFVWIIMGLLILGLAGFGATNLSGTIRTLGHVGDETISIDKYGRALQSEIRQIEAQTGQARSAIAEHRPHLEPVEAVPQFTGLRVLAAGGAKRHAHDIHGHQAACLRCGGPRDPRRDELAEQPLAGGVGAPHQVDLRRGSSRMRHQFNRHSRPLNTAAA